MKRPSFQFYPADWTGNIKLRRCSDAARARWMDILCALHDSDDYGMVHWPLEELASVAGAPLKLVKELVAKDVLKGADKGRIVYIHTPRHAGKDGDPATLIDVDGPCWYSSRMVRDEWTRGRRGASTRFTADNQADGSGDGMKHNSQSPTRRVGERQGDEPSGGTGPGPSSSSSSAETSTIEAKASMGASAENVVDPAGRPDWWPSRDRYGRVLGDVTDKLLFDVGKAVLGKSAGGQIAKLKKTSIYGRDWRAALELLLRADDAAEPAAWFAKALRRAEMDEPLDPMHAVYPEKEYRA